MAAGNRQIDGLGGRCRRPIGNTPFPCLWKLLTARAGPFARNVLPRISGSRILEVAKRSTAQRIRGRRLT